MKKVQCYPLLLEYKSNINIVLRLFQVFIICALFVRFFQKSARLDIVKLPPLLIGSFNQIKGYFRIKLFHLFFVGGGQRELLVNQMTF